MEGIVGKLVKELERKVFQTPGEGKEFMEEWFKEENISRCVYRGEASFQGNQAEKIASCTASLEVKFELDTESEIQTKAKPFIKALTLFNEVKKACFSQELQDDYESVIMEFCLFYRSLQISIPLKVHILESHIVPFLKMKDEKAGLGFYSEQAMEACHHDFKYEWEREKVIESQPEYLETLLRVVT